MKNNQFLRAILIMVVTVVVFGVAAFGLNFITGPIIEKNNAGAALGALKEVMPEGQSFEDITATITIDASTGIKEVYKETTGKGFVFKGEKAGYSKTVYATVGVTADGKVCGLVFNENGDFPVSEDTINSFIGKDSALADIVLTGGASTSSKTLKAIVEAGMNILISNNLITAGIKSDEQIYEELISTVFGSFKKGEASIELSGNVVAAYKAHNDAGYAYVMTSGETKVLALCNNFGVCKIYQYSVDETSGEYSLNDVTTQYTDLVTEAITFTNNNLSYQDAQEQKLVNKFTSLMGATDVESISPEIFNTVVAAIKFNVEGSEYYGFYSRSYGFEDMNVFVAIDSEGKIAKVSAETLIFHEEYFFGFGGVPSGYLTNLEGLTGTSYDGSQTLISGATMTSNSMAQSLKDAFAAYEALKNGGSN